jgi:hypothetical protein
MQDKQLSLIFQSLNSLRTATKMTLKENYSSIIEKYKIELIKNNSTTDYMLLCLNNMLQNEYTERPINEQTYLICAFLDLLDPNHQLQITNHQSQVTNHQSPITNHE